VRVSGTALICTFVSEAPGTVDVIVFGRARE
jgi:hypothetical protein